jgi:hypothetical protein
MSQWTWGAALPMLLVAAALGAQREPVTKPAPGTGIEDLAPVPSVTARQTGPNEVTVIWPSVRGANGFVVGRLAPPNGWARVYPGRPSDTVFVDTKVERGHRYTYSVRVDYSASRVSRVSPTTVSDTVEIGDVIATSGGGGGTITPTGGGSTTNTVESRDVIAARAYESGRTRNVRWWIEGERLHKQPWLRAAAASDLSEQELVTNWEAVGVTAIVYQHLLARAPNAAELRQHVTALSGGTPWRDVWRQIAQSPEREQRFGAWAGAPLTITQARSVFGFTYPRTGEQCFGGVGPGCEGGVPEMYGWVQPRWHDYFQMPDGTRMASVELGVAVGSILHDNACIDAPQGQGVACQGYEALSDLTKHAGLPAAMEWHKAAWNVMDERGWRTNFGPYPVDSTERRLWYDDVRPVPARRAMMAKPLGPLSLPILDQPYRGRERRASRALEAPAGTRLDNTDAAFCQKKQFKNEESPFGKAPLGICW